MISIIDDIIMVFSYAFYSFLGIVLSLIVILGVILCVYNILWPQGCCSALIAGEAPGSMQNAK